MNARISGSMRSRLLLIAGTAALSLLVTLIGSALIGAQQTRGLRDVEQRLVPKLELGPKLQAEFEHLRQAMQDAVSAQDLPALEATLDIRNQIFETIGSSSGVLGASDAALLRWTLHDYYQTAHDVSRRLIAGETGEDLVDVIARMQAEQAKASALIKRTTGLSRDELAGSFAAVVSASQRADRFRSRFLRRNRWARGRDWGFRSLTRSCVSTVELSSCARSRVAGPPRRSSSR
jgi:hypothetical protein